ncbi:rhodanese-like domain-containing protein [Aquimarina gracilis]|uniref:Rhodanese-like domain-containing protein n=1 Tax=Aquimarina gracilis TaxID=874422 RepID=A0ABU5ZSJ1_9FLAO|nr:rhodanese-like domain-containing protein [Aquimarina gracilis]MEB3345012.1 rhodanese-like domain-containing protein [Aquimarina gracilis]
MKSIFIMMFLSRLFFGHDIQNSGKIEVLDVMTFKKSIINKQVQLVDVRTLKEYENGHIEGAINIDFFQRDVFEASFNKLNKELPVYIYCRSGGRSKVTARRLIKIGFTKIYDLKGGYLVWK